MCLMSNVMSKVLQIGLYFSIKAKTYAYSINWFDGLLWIGFVFSEQIR